MTDMATIDLQALLRSGSFAGLLEAIDQSENVTKESRSTIAERQESLAEALSNDLMSEKLIELQETLTGYMDHLARAEVEFDGVGTDLTPNQLSYLMRRDQDTRQIKELAEVVNKGLKRIIFEAITAQVARENPDEPFPEYVSGSIDVPGQGLRFCKEGAGRKTPLLDQEKLRGLVGEKLWARCVLTVDVPAHTETHFSEDLFKAEMLKDPALMQKLQAALHPAGWNAGSYTVRKIKAKK